MTDPTPLDSPHTQASNWEIDRARALGHVQPPLAADALDIAAQTGSTNTDLMQRLKSLPRDQAVPGFFAVRAAYRQTAGRGRQGRRWHATPGHALMFSVATIVPRPLAGLAGLSLAAGTVLAEALRQLPGLDARQASRIGLKWPNDVLLDEGKLAGILVETAWSTPVATATVIGIGINVRPDEALAAELAAASTDAPEQAPPKTAAALSQLLPDANLTDTLAAVLPALRAMLDRFGAEGFAPFAQRWAALHAYAGREVALIEQGRVVAHGIALGVDAMGQLLLDTGRGVEVIATGDVSLRLASAPCAPSSP
ncbi:biotin--[acetyl-CoA-carboxylase] ligase [Trinickia caryophylli]|uniref:biotin--[biotin carboxyl-carrier protein] ligase n=1 Tax=Trinickia caryophylli TaxID=28094 RepID=A0A1X7END5_TRICW|nr:biotin--[acetyl-CoA-carboxylase] ligase [Trinickia caryophylli]PMS10265.1 biotin--[acetyl-CoA-carboxylase] ligase [Trinickia caryophylli]TRX18735.1 biotin--[acetyl-CoA-carboxylase] ligase [Trinickia caryophylli]WQE10469.1 biotin--[acetyl-CoA-carboxylase] ligase [Trinickia caryophylli]SMF37133.1 BirA family transcriptional regulator, biotin operon repressor / biotin-[acetyl-CoA-carboxylase] ligase [Trinickia caryophylli]GLU32819.1 biotin--[acetyl-CoA-carboxylase] ligase [Trinickia caryophyll